MRRSTSKPTAAAVVSAHYAALMRPTDSPPPRAARLSAPIRFGGSGGVAELAEGLHLAAVDREHVDPSGSSGLAGLLRRVRVASDHEHLVARSIELLGQELGEVEVIAD